MFYLDSEILQEMSVRAAAPHEVGRCKIKDHWSLPVSTGASSTAAGCEFACHARVGASWFATVDILAETTAC